MLTWRWIISHRYCWKTVYVSCCNAQLNLIVIILSYTCIVMRSLFVNCPAVICLPNMWVIFYGETPLVNCGPRSILLHWNKHRLHHGPPSFARCPLFSFTFIFHTIRLILCFQQAGEIDNLPVSFGQSSLIMLCAGSTSALVLRHACWRGTCTQHNQSILPQRNRKVVNLLGLLNTKD